MSFDEYMTNELWLKLSCIENNSEQSLLPIFTLYGGRCCGRDLFIFSWPVLGCFYHQLASLQVALDAGVVDTDDEHDHQTKDEHYDACIIFPRYQGRDLITNRPTRRLTMKPCPSNSSWFSGWSESS